VAGSLRDQLVKAGLATSSQAKKAERQQRVESQARRRSNQQQGTANSDKDQARQRAQQLNAQKVKRDREIAAKKNKKYSARALRAEIKQIILQNDLRAKGTKDDIDKYVPYNFVHGKKIKKIYVPVAQKILLSAGDLVIVNNDGLYHFVTRQVAEQIANRDPKRIIVAHADKPTEPSEDDEYYAKFAVPDDLDW
jgi:hypothetical protein